MNEWIAESKAEIIFEKVNSIRVSNNHQLNLTGANESKIFDAVHLCTGIFPYKDPYNLKDHPHTIAEPFTINKKLAELPYGAKIGIICKELTRFVVFNTTIAHSDYLYLTFFNYLGT